MSDKKATHIAFLLDRSGSMWGIKNDVEGGFNAFIDTQKDAEGTCLVTFAQFNSIYETVYENKPVKDVEKLVLNPSGSTALYDSMGKLITETTAYLNSLPKKKRPASVICAIMTDGMENSSREWTSEGVKRLVEERTEEGWQFLYMGADQDAIEEAGKMGILADNAMTYKRGSVGSAMRSMGANIVNYRGDVAMGNMSASVAYSAEQREDAVKF